LFDQSLQFDADLSRYFLQKGWAVSQFSILRPMSELLIEKTLVERYPDLQHLQTSCHAAHKGETRILPCGKCEKCRRMVGMLLALGADPRNCGYSEWQIRGCLATLPSKALSQEAPARAHLMHLLQERGLVDATVVAQAHPEVLALRFDSERSPLKAIPMDLRIPLLEILMSHANGALWRKGDTWLPFDPVNSREIRRPYLFEVDPLEPTEDRCRWGRLAWPDVQSYLEQVDLAILPVGAVEQHGPHLPLETDAFDAEYLSQRVAAACSDPKPLVLPLIPYGVSYHHQDFPGTLTIDNDTLAKMVYDIGLSVVRNGIRKFVILNGHGGNAPALNYAAQMINRDTHIFVCVETGESSDVDVDRLIDTPNDVHAGEVETSTCLAVRPHLVRMERAEASVPVFSSRYLDFTSRRGISWYAATRRLSDSGVLGDPGKASAAKGRRIWEIMIAHLVAFVEDLKHMSLDEIHHRHY
jgi:creatinine amidohydrolase/Fe(II)-dependent formamide hydrolase-like protein